MGRVVFVADYEWKCFCVKTSIKSFLEVESHRVGDLRHSGEDRKIWEGRRLWGGEVGGLK